MVTGSPTTGSSVIGPRIVAGTVTTALAVPAFHYLKGLPWSLAALVGLACGALAFLVVRAVQNLQAWRPR